MSERWKPAVGDPCEAMVGRDVRGIEVWERGRIVRIHGGPGAYTGPHDSVGLTKYDVRFSDSVIKRELRRRHLRYVDPVTALGDLADG